MLHINYFIMKVNGLIASLRPADDKPRGRQSVRAMKQRPEEADRDNERG